MDSSRPAALVLVPQALATSEAVLWGTPISAV
jgi:hypothetical protein